MSQHLESDYHRVIDGLTQTRFLPGTAIEIVRDVELAEPPEHVLFDFDGTLSLVREGWPEVMVPMMVEVLRETGTDEPAETLETLVHDFVMALCGKQTIYQMIRLVEEIDKRGGKAEDPFHYKKIYDTRLLERIRSRRENLESRSVKPEDFVVPGSFDMLDALKDRGVSLYLASGTDEVHVREEVALLGLDQYFGDNIHGAIEDYQSHSKAQVIERILSTHAVSGAKLLGFGDGYVEIENVKAASGTAIAVASDEAGRSGKPDAWKRDRLIGSGADLVIPDYREHAALIAYLWRG